MVCNSIYTSWHRRGRLPWRTYYRLQNLKSSFKYIIANLNVGFKKNWVFFFLMKFVLNQLLGRPQLKCADFIISHLYTVNYKGEILLRTAAISVLGFVPLENHIQREKALLSALYQQRYHLSTLAIHLFCII